MPIIQNYRCRSCDKVYEFLHHPKDGPAICPWCASEDAELCISSAHVFSTIVPDYPGAKKIKAGYQHLFENRPAEKISVSVPRKIGE